MSRRLAEIARVTDAKLGESRHSFTVFGGPALHQAEGFYQFAAPGGEAIRELEFENDALSKGQRWVVHCGGEDRFEAGLGANGAVESQGTHEELVAQGGRYAELFELQAAGYR